MKFVTLMLCLMHLYTKDGTDFTLLMEILMVSGGSQRVCVDIPISNDSIVEYNETFDIVLSTTDEAIILDFETAEVLITNDDSKLHRLPQDKF